ncbi:IclR family transcriptional regulator [uncultured Clostridium sp.]|uniref:IclR family transcriptional regulator n=1 Tax=uncultured Clostridium sp. TaxID=59620 RepID=UPI0025DBDC1A|nr:IclR family transcriptional regulator [uncultured Clostridium sp.]
MSEGSEKAKGLQTVERALDVLYLFREYEGITLSFVAEKLNMSPAVAYRLLYTLTGSGFLRQERAGKRYYLGEKSLMLGYQAIRSQEIRQTAYPVMEKLKQRCGLDVYLTVSVDMQSLCVEKLDVEDDLQLSMRVGGIYPIHKGASNRPLLAFADEKARESYISSLKLGEEEKKKLEGEMEEVRKRGYDYTRGLLSPGLFAIGIPVFGMRNRLAGCISVGGYSVGMKEEKFDSYLKETAAAAAEISRLSGAEEQGM